MYRGQTLLHRLGSKSLFSLLSPSHPGQPALLIQDAQQPQAALNQLQNLLSITRGGMWLCGKHWGDRCVDAPNV